MGDITIKWRDFILSSEHYKYDLPVLEKSRFTIIYEPERDLILILFVEYFAIFLIDISKDQDRSHAVLHIFIAFDFGKGFLK